MLRRRTSLGMKSKVSKIASGGKDTAREALACFVLPRSDTEAHMPHFFRAFPAQKGAVYHSPQILRTSKNTAGGGSATQAKLSINPLATFDRERTEETGPPVGGPVSSLRPSCRTLSIT